MLVDVFANVTTETEMRERADGVVAAMKKGELKLSEVSIRDIAEATLGAAGMRALSKPSEGGLITDTVKEAVAPVNLSLFSHITGQMIYQGIYEAYSAPEYIGEQLVTMETSREDNTRVPGIAPIDDDALEVEEGGEYPDVKFGEDYVDIPQSKKRGLKIGVTREAVFFDRTGQVLEQARTVGDRLALNREKRILRTVLGIDNTFKRKGVTRDTYVTAAENAADPRKNEVVQELTDYKSLDTIMAMFSAMKDDRKVGEPIVVAPKIMLVNDALVYTARDILKATEVTLNPGVTSGVSTRMPNPYNGQSLLVASPWVRALLEAAGVSAANAAKYWYMGDFKRAFRYRTLFPLQVIAAQNDKDSFDRDVVAQFRADERGVPYVWAPWYVVNAHGA
jgi:hypothetical protein